jgi:hypothetical protein
MDDILSVAAGQSQVPELVEAQLDPEQLHRLFDDYRRAAGVRSVRARPAGRLRADDGPTSLDDAEPMLKTGGRVQVRYEYHGAQWCDTLTPTSEGVRLVRMRLPSD